MRLALRSLRGRRVGVLAVLPLLITVGCRRDGAGRADDPPAALNRSDPAPAVAELPLAGTEIPLFPAGEARELAQTHCVACHASDMIQQQRLTEAQWRAEVDKMQRWGADVRDEDKAALVFYLSSLFGPDNNRFTPILAAPYGLK